MTDHGLWALIINSAIVVVFGASIVIRLEKLRRFAVLEDSRSRTWLP